jgi:hypothetical protein
MADSNTQFMDILAPFMSAIGSACSLAFVKGYKWYQKMAAFIIASIIGEYGPAVLHIFAHPDLSNGFIRFGVALFSFGVVLQLWEELPPFITGWLKARNDARRNQP